MCKMD